MRGTRERDTHKRERHKRERDIRQEGRIEKRKARDTRERHTTSERHTTGKQAAKPRKTTKNHPHLNLFLFFLRRGVGNTIGCVGNEIGHVASIVV